MDVCGDCWIGEPMLKKKEKKISFDMIRIVNFDGINNIYALNQYLEVYFNFQIDFSKIMDKKTYVVYSILF